MLLAVAALCLASCKTVKKTATTYDVDTAIKSFSEAELSVSQKKATYTYKASKKVARGGAANIKRAAVSELLKQNGNADVLVAPQYETCGKKVVVSGYPATYVKFEKVR